jgi:phosphatidylinositol alpha-1,6-mannosyltransferase
MKDQPMSKIGGMQRVGIDMLENLRAQDGVTVSELLLRTPAGQEKWHLIQFLARSYVEITRRMRAGDIDVVMFSAMPSAVLAAVLAGPAQRAGVALVAISHGHDVIANFAPYQWLVRRVMHRLDAMLPVSLSTGTHCVSRGLPSERLFVTPNGIDPDRFGSSMPPVMITRKARRALLEQRFPTLAAATRPGDLLLCSVGRQVKRKGHEWFVRHVMPKLPATVHLVLGGTGPEADAIARAAASTGVAGRVHALGMVDEADLAALYSSCDLFVMPNVRVPGDIEGFGVVMLEAGLCAMPSIAARIEGISDVITDGRNGFGVATQDTQAFVDVISQFVGQPTRLDALSASARAHTLATFTWSGIAGRVVDTLRQVVDRKRRSQ